MPIGKEIARTYAKEGAKVVIADFNEVALKEVVQEFTDQGYEAFRVKVNVLNEVVVVKMVDDNMQATANVEDDVWSRVMSINVDGVMRIMRKVIPVFIENGGEALIKSNETKRHLRVFWFYY